MKHFEKGMVGLCAKQSKAEKKLGPKKVCKQRKAEHFWKRWLSKTKFTYNSQPGENCFLWHFPDTW